MWHEIPIEQLNGETCIKLHSEDGFGSMGPDIGLAVDVWSVKDCMGEPIHELSKLMCPGSDLLGSQHINSGWKDLWVRVDQMKRKDVKKVPKECEFS